MDPKPSGTREGAQPPTDSGQGSESLLQDLSGGATTVGTVPSFSESNPHNDQGMTSEPYA